MIKTYTPELRFPEFHDEWQVKRLGLIAKLYKGKGISKSEALTQGKTPCVRYGELYTYYGEAIKETKSYTNVPYNDLFLGKQNDIVMPSSGETKEDIATASCLMKDNIALGGDINVIRLENNDGLFFAYYLRNGKKNDISKIAQGMSIIHLYNEQLSNLFVSFPTFAEQRKIALCLSSLDDLIKSVGDKIELLKQHKKGLMQKLFPKLTGKKMANPELRFPEFHEDWQHYSMETIFEMKNGYTPSKLNPDFWEKGTIPWFRMEDIRRNGYVLSDSIQHVTPDAVKNSGLFPAYSIIVATTATIGEHALIIVDSLANQQFTFLTKRKSFNNTLDMIFFHQYMFIIDKWCKRNTNSSGLLSVNMPAFKQLQVSIPSIPEQRKIAECMSSLDTKIEQYESKLQQLERHKKGLMQKMFVKF